MGKCATLVLVFLAYLSGESMVAPTDACYLDSIPGGCPDKNACYETCRPCYRGVGLVYTYCVAPGGGIYWWRCRCDFMKGAPCPPVGPPTCPKPPTMAHYNLSHSHYPPASALVHGDIAVDSLASNKNQE